eukprot:10389360-Lingulodinium_polyedra.AAC.1
MKFNDRYYEMELAGVRIHDLQMHKYSGEIRGNIPNGVNMIILQYMMINVCKSICRQRNNKQVCAKAKRYRCAREEFGGGGTDRRSLVVSKVPPQR